VEKGVLTKERAEDLLNKDFENIDVILHEMGIPPIHTPAEVLAGFSENVKKHMFLVHVAERDIPKGKGLKSGPVGLENSIILIQDVPPKHDLYRKLNLLASINLFEGLNII